jgi:hypothetical protein
VAATIPRVVIAFSKNADTVLNYAAKAGMISVEYSSIKKETAIVIFKI